MNKAKGISIKKIIATSRLLSLDVVLGSLASCVLAEHLAGITMPTAWWIILPLAVWSLYTTDHILDSQGRDNNNLQARHSFHARYRNTLGIFAAISALASILLAALFMPGPVIMMGVVLGLISALYLQLLRKGILPNLVFHKEILVAMIYTAGIWGAPIIISWPEFSNAFILLLVSFLFNAYLNLLILTWFESKADRSANQKSLDQLTREGFLTQYIPIISIPGLGLPILVLLVYPGYYLSAAILIVMTLLHLLIFAFSTRMQKNDIYRPAAEAVFFLPLIQIFKQ